MMNKLVPITLAVAGCLLLVSAQSCFKNGFLKTKCERLPNNVVPTKYQLELKFPSLDTETYQGRVNISVKFASKMDSEYEQLAKGLVGATCEPKESNRHLLFHFDPSLKLEDIAIYIGPMVREKKREIRRINYVNEKQLLEVKTWKPFNTAGTATISISFTGQLRNDQRGVYVSKYKEYKHIVSQFQPTDARLVFPVFDEPRFKAPFQVNIIHPRGLTALSTTDALSVVEDVSETTMLVKTIFKQTPPMSAHMLAFTVGQFDVPLEVESMSRVGNDSYKVRVFTAPGQRESGHFALDVAQRSLEYFEDYIFYQFPLHKLDIVAITDHGKDNTGSWGLSFIRDSLVSIDDETKPDTRITTALNVAHVCVHQWFGNLVTAAWWNDLWITEGVAAQFAFKIVRELYPEFEGEKFVRLDTSSEVMQIDAPGDLRALSTPLDKLRTSEQIHAMYENVELMESASQAQMINKWLDKRIPNWYQQTLSRLVRKFAHQAINYHDYIQAIGTLTS